MVMAASFQNRDDHIAQRPMKKTPRPRSSPVKRPSVLKIYDGLRPVKRPSVGKAQ